MASDVELRARTRLARVVSYVPGRKRVFELVDIRFKSKGDIVGVLFNRFTPDNGHRGAQV